MKKLLFCGIALALAFLGTSSSPLSASPECPQSCIAASVRCFDLCQGCPHDDSKCIFLNGCYQLQECVCRQDLC